MNSRRPSRHVKLLPLRLEVVVGGSQNPPHPISPFPASPKCVLGSNDGASRDGARQRTRTRNRGNTQESGCRHASECASLCWLAVKFRWLAAGAALFYGPKCPEIFLFSVANQQVPLLEKEQRFFDLQSLTRTSARNTRRRYWGVFDWASGFCASSLSRSLPRFLPPPPPSLRPVQALDGLVQKKPLRLRLGSSSVGASNCSVSHSPSSCYTTVPLPNAQQ